LRLHLISFDIPFPPDYGGVIDVFYKIKALHQLGVKVVLHCFQYGNRQRAPEISTICEKVYYYKRSTHFVHQLSLRPFIVSTRANRTLLANLLQDESPIFFEGLHATAFIGHQMLKNRFKLLRMHNIEWRYYRHLGTAEREPRKKIFYQLESWRLKRYEQQAFIHADVIFPISSSDAAYIADNNDEHISAKLMLLPPFHGNKEVEATAMAGKYILFHAKLSVPDNEKAAIFLIRSVFTKIQVPFIIAGLDPSAYLKTIVSQYAHIQLIDAPSHYEMQRLLHNAHINLLYSFQGDGMKLKLLNALYHGRFCIANNHVIIGTGLESAVQMANTSEEIISIIHNLMIESFSEQELEERRELLGASFSDDTNAKIIVKALEQHLGVIIYD
jgi:glycosyltransferase involved in cell wall biosynthesis